MRSAKEENTREEGSRGQNLGDRLKRKREDFPAKGPEASSQCRDGDVNSLEGTAKEARFPEQGRDLEVRDWRVKKEALGVGGLRMEGGHLLP